MTCSNVLQPCSDKTPETLEGIQAYYSFVFRVVLDVVQVSINASTAQHGISRENTQVDLGTYVRVEAGCNKLLRC